MKLSSRTSALLAIALFCTGCTILPIEKAPSTTLPTSWSISSKNQASHYNGEWWKAFGSAELNRLLDRALLNNRNLDSVRQNLELARVQWHASLVPWAPEISAGASIGRSGVWGQKQQNSSYGNSLNLTYTPDVWGTQRAVERSSEALWRAAASDVDATALALRFSVITQYLQLLSVREQMSLATINLETGHRILALVESRYRAGSVAELDLVQQRTLTASLEVSIPPIRQQSQQIMTTLAALLDLTPQELSIQANSLSDLKLPETSSGIPSDLLLRRADVQAAEARLISAGANIDAARSAMFPTISLSAGMNTASARLNQLMHMDPSWATGLALSLPLWDQERRVDQQRTALLTRKIAINSYRDTILTAFGEIENALHAKANIQAQQFSQDVELQSARAALLKAESRYRAGALELQSLLTAQTEFYNAQQTANELRYQLLQAICNLQVALGGT